MKKTYIILSILVIGSLTACKKEYSSSDVFKDLSIKATVTNLDTKTTYNKSGSTYEFSWVQNDVISVMLIDGASNRDRFNYTTTEATPGASAVFNPVLLLMPSGVWQNMLFIRQIQTVSLTRIRQQVPLLLWVKTSI